MLLLAGPTVADMLCCAVLCCVSVLCCVRLPQGLVKRLREAVVEKRLGQRSAAHVDALETQLGTSHKEAVPQADPSSRAPLSLSSSVSALGERTPGARRQRRLCPFSGDADPAAEERDHDAPQQCRPCCPLCGEAGLCRRRD